MIIEYFNTKLNQILSIWYHLLSTTNRQKSENGNRRYITDKKKSRAYTLQGAEYTPHTRDSCYLKIMILFVFQSMQCPMIMKMLFLFMSLFGITCKQLHIYHCILMIKADKTGENSTWFTPDYLFSYIIPSKITISFKRICYNVTGFFIIFKF